MKFLIVVFFCPLITGLNEVESNIPLFKSKIVGGEIVKEGILPYVVFLKIPKKGFVCGGCLISKIHILTTAHCIEDFIEKKEPKYEGLLAVVGTSSLKNDGIPHPIKHLDVHHLFDINDKQSFADIGLVTLYKEVELSSKVSVAKLPTSDIQPETHAVICGWGNTEKILDPPKHIYKASDNLRMVTVKIISPEECEEKQHFIAVNSSYVCTVTDNSDENASRGDSGSPLIQNETVVAILSRGSTKEDSPVIYTKVFYYLDYIEEAKKGETRNKTAKHETVTILPSLTNNDTNSTNRISFSKVATTLLDCFKYFKAWKNLAHKND